MLKRYGAAIRQQLKGIGARLMALYLLLLLVPVVGIGIYGHFYIQATLTRNAIQNGLDEVAVRAMTIDTLLGQVHDDILYLEQRIAAIQSNATEQRDPTAELTGLALSHPMYHYVAWLDTDSRLLGGYLPQALADWVTTDAFRRVADLSPNTIRFIPLRATDETAEALLIATVRLEAGTLLFDINTAYMLQSMTANPDTDEWALLIEPNTLLTLSDVLASDSLGIEQMEGTSGSVSVNERINLYHSTGPGGNWTLIHSLPRAAIGADLTGYYTTFFIIVLGGFTSVGGLALLAIARVIDPVYRLEEMVDQLRQGVARPALPEPLPEDEFGKLMVAFDQMADELDQKRLRERALIEQLIRAQEEERKLIAYNLHDGLIQELVGARFYLGQIRNACAEQLGEKAKNLTQSYDILTHAIAEGRRIIQGLHPTVLEDLGLEPALRELTKSMSETATWQMDVEIDTLDIQPDRATSVTLYRITQEALNNAFKHARATHVWLTLRADTHKNTLNLCIKDNGCGFEADSIFRNGVQHWGIKTMRERATMLHGICEIHSRPEHGTTIQVTIPYERERIAQ